MPETGNPRWVALTRATIVLSIAAIVALLFGLTYTTVQAREQSARNGEELNTVRETNQRIIDCTEPTGGCYQRNQKATTGLLGQPSGPINSVTVAANYCAIQFAREQQSSLFTEPEFHKFTKCVRAHVVIIVGGHSK